MALDRSEQMRRIRSRDTKPELLLRKALWHKGLRYRVYSRTPVGKPDLVFLARRLAVFIDGCQWHGCPRHYVFPRTRREFWLRKLRTNFERDQGQTLLLEDLGWKVVRIWEHEVFEDLESATARVEAALRGDAIPLHNDWRVVSVEPLDEVSDIECRTTASLRSPGKLESTETKRSTRKWAQNPSSKKGTG